MKPYDSTHGQHGCQGFMYGIAWKCVDHIGPCMELHGRFLNSDMMDTGGQKPKTFSAFPFSFSEIQ